MYSNSIKINESGSSTPETNLSTPTLEGTPLLFDTKEDLQIKCMVKTRIPTPYGNFYLHLYKNNWDDKEHLALVYGDKIKSTSLNELWLNDDEKQRIIRGAELDFKECFKVECPLVRIHSECFTGETIFSKRCDCGEQLENAMKAIQVAGHGVILYLRQEGRNIGLLNKMRAYNLQDLGHDTVDANVLLGLPIDGRDYKIAQYILKDLNIKEINLLTNNPAKVSSLKSLGFDIKERIEMVPLDWSKEDFKESVELNKYLRTKVLRMGHLLSLPTF